MYVIGLVMLIYAYACSTVPCAHVPCLCWGIEETLARGGRRQLRSWTLARELTDFSMLITPGPGAEGPAVNFPGLWCPLLW